MCIQGFELQSVFGQAEQRDQGIIEKTVLSEWRVRRVRKSHS